MNDPQPERRRLPRLNLDLADGLVGLLTRPQDGPQSVPASILDISRIGFRLVFEAAGTGDLPREPVLLLDQIIGTATIRFDEPVQLAIKWLKADPRNNHLTLGCEISHIAESDRARVARYVDAEMRWKRGIRRENGAPEDPSPDADATPLQPEDLEAIPTMAPAPETPRKNVSLLAGVLLAGLLVAATAALWPRRPAPHPDPRLAALESRLRSLEEQPAAAAVPEERLLRLEAEVQALRQTLSDSAQANLQLTRHLEALEARMSQAAPPRSAVPAAAPAPGAPAGAPAAAAGYHTVGRGENLFRIALLHHTTVERLRAANNLQPDDPIRPGQRLKLPQ